MKLIDSTAKTKWKFIAIVVVLGLVVEGGIWWYGNSLRMESRTQQTIVARLTPTLIPSEIDTTTWQTYRNDEFGFEVRYPERFELENNERDYDLKIPRGSEYSPPRNFITVFDPVSMRRSEVPHEGYITWRDQFSVAFVRGQTAKEFAQYAYKYNQDYNRDGNTSLVNVGDLKETNVWDYKAYTFQCDTHCSEIPWKGVLSVGSRHKVVYLQNDQLVFMLLVTEKPVFEQILSTFRFVK